jgi:methionyl-tRNA formyltransferase
MLYSIFAFFQLEEKRDLMERLYNRIIFMGTPEFAVHILEQMLHTGLNVVGVVTAPDKPAGRGQQMNESAVKKCARELGVPTLQPDNLKDSVFLEQLSAFNADLFVVVAFRMLPEVVWSMPPKGTINLHASILPQYRGAAPINRAIMNGESETGVTTFFIEKDIDTGKIIEQNRLNIGPEETAGELHDRLMLLGAETTISTARKIFSGEATGIDQSDLMHNHIKSAPKIFRNDCRIDWKLNVAEVHNFIRGLSPYPAAWTELISTGGDRKTFKLFRSVKTDIAVSDPFTLIEHKEGILFPCSDRYILISELQPEGKRKMNHKEFLAGNRLSDWIIQP